MTTSHFHGKDELCHYRVVRKGEDYVIIHSDAQLDKGRDIRIRFVDEGRGYWIQTPLGFDERFDRVEER